MTDDFMPLDEAARRPPVGGEDRSQKSAQPKPRRFVLQPFDEIRVGTVPQYLIKGLLPKAGLAIIWGAPKMGKTFFCISVAMHIALGWEFNGRKVRGGPVVYCSAEGGSGLPARIEAWRQRFLAEQSDPAPIYLVSAHLILAADHAQLVSDIKAQLDGEKPGVICVETLNRTLGGSESDDTVMAAYVAACVKISEEFECLVVIVHHSGHSEGRMRGHSLLIGALDVELEVKKDDEDKVTVTVQRNRDGPAGGQIRGKLEFFTIATDTEGDDITSGVFILADDQTPIASREKAARLPAGVQMLLKTMRDLMPDHGKKMSPFGIEGPEVIGVDREKLRAEFYARWPADGATDKARAEAKRKQFGRAEQTAIAKQIIASREIEGVTYSWMASKSSSTSPDP